MRLAYELDEKGGMELHQLRYFVAAAEELSITAAAKRVHLSQPALSRQIRALEEELGVALFERVRQRIHLTEAGRFFLQRARQLLCDAETTVQQVRERFSEEVGTIRLGFLTLFLDDIVTPALRELKRSGVKSDIALYELSPQAQLDRLRNDEIDLALLGNLGDDDASRFTIVSLMQSPMMAVLPEEHPLARRKQIDLKELVGEGFVSLSDHVFPGRRQFLRGICQSRGFEPEIVEECASLPLVLASVSGGRGVALLPEHSRKLPHAGAVFVRLKVPTVYAEMMAVHKPGADTGALKQLLVHLGEAAASL